MDNGTPTAIRAAAPLGKRHPVSGQIRNPSAGALGANPAGQRHAGLEYVQGEVAQMPARFDVAGCAGQHLPVVIDQPQLNDRPPHRHAECLDYPVRGDGTGVRLGQPQGDGGFDVGEPGGPARVGDVVGKGVEHSPTGLLGDRQGHLDRELVAVAVQRGQLQLLSKDSAGFSSGEAGETGAVCVTEPGRNDQFGDVPIAGLRGAVAEDPLGGWIPSNHPAVVLMAI